MRSPGGFHGKRNRGAALAQKSSYPRNVRPAGGFRTFTNDARLCVKKVRQALQGNRISKALTVALGWWTGRESILPGGTAGATGRGWGWKVLSLALEDPRTGNAGLHDLLEMLFIALCTVLSGGQSAVDMAMFAREKGTFLREFLKLERGLPSHDTFSRIFRLLDPEQFRACFQRFMARFAEPAKGSSRSTARWCDDRSTRPVGNRRCTWSPPGDAISAWCWRRSPPTPSRTRSLPSSSY
jgi:DDE_Tnp_1-associated